MGGGKDGPASFGKALSPLATVGRQHFADTRPERRPLCRESIPEAIADDAETWPADLIVIGTHGRQGLARLFVGSVAEGIARVASKPVLLVRGE